MNFHIHGNRGIGITIYGIDLGYNCSYDAVGERIDKESMSHSGCIGPIQFGTNGDVLVGVNVAINHFWCKHTNYLTICKIVKPNMFVI